jgi:hypothetical protein
MAHRYGMVGRRIPAVMVHVSVGTANVDLRRGMVSQAHVPATVHAQTTSRSSRPTI